MRVNVNATMDREAMQGVIIGLMPHINPDVIITGLEEVYSRINVDEALQIHSLSGTISDGLAISLHNMETGDGHMVDHITHTHMWAGLAQVIIGNYVFTREV